MSTEPRAPTDEEIRVEVVRGRRGWYWRRRENGKIVRRAWDRDGLPMTAAMEIACLRNPDVDGIYIQQPSLRWSDDRIREFYGPMGLHDAMSRGTAS